MQRLSHLTYHHPACRRFARCNTLSLRITLRPPRAIAAEPLARIRSASPARQRGLAEQNFETIARRLAKPGRARTREAQPLANRPARSRCKSPTQQPNPAEHNTETLARRPPSPTRSLTRGTQPPAASPAETPSRPSHNETPPRHPTAAQGPCANPPPPPAAPAPRACPRGWRRPPRPPSPSARSAWPRGYSRCSNAAG